MPAEGSGDRLPEDEERRSPGEHGLRRGRLGSRRLASQCGACTRYAGDA